MSSIKATLSNLLDQVQYPAHPYTSTHCDEMESITRAWIDQYDCLTPEIRYKAKISSYGVLTADVLPRADMQTLKPITRWMLWAFIFDDFYGPYPKDELKRICRNALATISNEPIPPANAIFDQLRITCAELREQTTPQWMNRFLKSHKFYFQGLLMDTFSYKEHRTYPTEEQYFKIRDRLIGGFMVMDLLELISDKIMPDEIIYHPDIHRMRLLASRLMIYDNDIFSYQKELLEGESMNLVLVIANERGISIEKALKETIRIRKKDYLELLAFNRKIGQFGKWSRQVLQYWENTMILLEGQLKWYKIKSQRYGITND